MKKKLMISTHKYFTALIVAGGVFLVGNHDAAAQKNTPYAGMQQREIKAMPQSRIDDLRAGKGAGYALTAELNGYPGPRHVLDFGDVIGLTPAQRQETDRLFTRMQNEVKPLGAKLLEQEAALEKIFAAGKANETRLTELVTAIAVTGGVLRATHLKYHLTMKTLLTERQIVSYNRLRGYDDSPGQMPHGGASGGSMQH